MKKESFNVLILAAGFGTRLKEHGKKVPKGLIKTSDNTLLGRVLQSVSALDNAQDVALITNARDFALYHTYFTQKSEPSVTLLSNGITSSEDRLGALKDLQLAIELLGWQDSNILVLPSDTYFSFDLSNFLQFSQEHQGFATIFREFKDPQKEIAGRLGCAVIENEKVIEFVEKPEVPPSPYGAIPIYYYPQSSLNKLNQFINEGNNPDAPGSIIPWFLKSNHTVFGFITTEQTRDIGKPEDLQVVSSL